MKLLKSKTGKLNQAVINTAILVIVLLVVLFQIYAAVIPEAQAAGNLMNDSNRCVDVGCFYNVSEITGAVCLVNSTETVSGALCGGADSIPLASLFSGTGIVFIIIMAALFILVIKSFMKSK